MATRASKAATPKRVDPAPEPKKQEPGIRTSVNRESVSPEEIRLCAYGKWESAGRPPGDGVNFWLEAEQELRQET
jgi:hypothetical protein